MAQNFPSLVFGILGLVAVWAARDGWIRWLRDRDARREVDAGLAALQDRVGARLAELEQQVATSTANVQADVARQLKTVFAAQQGIIDDMQNAKVEIDRIHRTVTSGALAGRRHPTVAIGLKG